MIEFTFTHERLGETYVDLDETTGEVLDVYTMRDNVGEWAEAHPDLAWQAERNPLFRHASAPRQTWDVVRRTFLDPEYDRWIARAAGSMTRSP